MLIINEKENLIQYQRASSNWGGINIHSNNIFPVEFCMLNVLLKHMHLDGILLF